MKISVALEIFQLMARGRSNLYLKVSDFILLSFLFIGGFYWPAYKPC